MSQKYKNDLLIDTPEKQAEVIQSWVDEIKRINEEKRSLDEQLAFAKLQIQKVFRIWNDDEIISSLKVKG